MKKKIINTAIVYFVIALLFIGCKQKKYEAHESNSFIVNYHINETEYFDDFFNINNMSIIQFEDDNPLFLSEKLQIFFAKDYLFIHDKGYEQLYRFAYTGKLINKIGQAGKGPAEYINTGFFSIDENQQTIRILSDNGSAIMIYDFDGRFLEKITTPLVVTSFDCINSNLYYYYTGYYNSPNSHRLHKADSVKILESYLPLQTKAFDMIEMNFTPMGDFGYFREAFFPSVYKYDSSGIQEVLKMDFGMYEITKQTLEKVEDPFVFFEKIEKSGFCSITTVISDKHEFYIGSIQQDISGTKVSHFHINLADSAYTRIVSNSKNQIEVDFFSQLKPAYLVSDDYICFLINPIVFKAFIQSRNDLVLQYPLQEDNLNPLLVIIPLKKNKYYASE